MALITVKDLSLGYDSKAIIEHLNFTVNEGDYLCIVGENGSGKTTLMKTLLHLKKPLAGAEVTCEIPVTPFFSVLLQFWDGDDEFPPKLSLLWDRNALRFLHFETTFFLQGDLLERLKQLLKN